MEYQSNRVIDSTNTDIVDSLMVKYKV